MRKLLLTGALVPLSVAGCFGGGTAKVSRETTLGTNVDYIEVNGEKFTQDTFYQMAKTSGWQKVKTWFDQNITKHYSNNIAPAAEVGKKGYDTNVNNALKQFDLFKASATNNGDGQLCDGVATGEYCYARAEEIVAQELIWEDYQSYKVRNNDTMNYSYALNIQRNGYTVTNPGAEPTNINSATFEADSRAWLNANLKEYIDNEIKQGAVDRLFTMNYLLSLETQSTYVDGGNTKSRPTTRLKSAYDDNNPTIWTVYKFEYDKVAQARTDITTVLANKAAGVGPITTAVDTGLKALTGFHSKYSGIGDKIQSFNADPRATAIAYSSKEGFRKEGFIDYEAENDDFDFIMKADESKDYFYVYHIEPIELAVNTTDDTLVRQPSHITNATAFKDTERLYAYFGLGGVVTLSTFARDFYYGEYDLRAFDETIYNFLSSNLDN